MDSQQSKHFIFVESLLRRISREDSEVLTIQEEFYRLEAGLAGERKLKQTLSDYMFKTDFHIFYNFECVNKHGFSHQIDTLIITPYYLLVLEVKQISGTLFYKPSQHEFYRVHDNNQSENFSNPFDQAYRHQLFLEHLLKKWKVDIPVTYAVIIANHRAKLDHSLRDFPIFHLSGIPTFLENLNVEYPHSSAKISFIQNKLTQLYSPLPPRRSIEQNRLRNGVLCRECRYVHVMYYQKGYWNCPVCCAKNKEALKETLHQYRVLISPRITNKEFRSFVKIENKEIASKILQRLGIEKVGRKKGTYYIIPEDIWTTE